MTMMKLLLICLFFTPSLLFADAPFYDPTTPLTTDVPTIFITDDELTLQAIFITPQHSYAIINNISLGLNQTIHGYQLIAINQESVQLKGDGGIVTLSLATQSVKKN